MRPKILLIESDPTAAQQIHAGLTALGHEPVATCADGRRALQLAGELEPEIALVSLDLDGARLGGIAVAQALRQQFEVAVFFLCGAADDESQRAAMPAEPFGYLTPPYDERQLRVVVQIALCRRRGGDRVREAREEHAAILQMALDGFWIADLTGRLIDVNDAYCRMSGYSRAELLCCTIADLTATEERAFVPQQIAQIVQAGACRFKTTHLRRDGSVLNVDVSVNHLPGSGGRLFGFTRDITGRKLAEQALRESESKFGKAFQCSSVMMALTQLEDGVFVEVNEQFLALSGFRREELIGRRTTDIGWVDPVLREKLRQRVIAEGRLQDVEIPVRKKDGDVLRVLYSADQLDVGGRHLLLSSWRDVTDQRRIESLSRLQSCALEAAANTIVIMDRDGMIQWSNPAFTRFSGYAPAESTGHTFCELLDSGQHSPGFLEEMRKSIRMGNVWRGEITNRRKDGALVQDETTITPVRLQGGEITHFVVVKQDITQRRILEEQFRQAQKMEAVGQLAGGVAHDFNNILAAVLMYLGILQDEPSIEPNLRGMLKELQKEVKRGAGLTRQLLTFSRQQAIEPQHLDLDQVLAGLMEMLSRLLGEHIAVVIEHGSEPLPTIEADLGMIEQVAINLCVNARDAMEAGGRLTLRTGAVEVTPVAAARHPEAQSGHYVRLDVADTGCGMDEKTRQRIFEPFFTTKPVGKGTGLGLATVYGIVKQHHGWIELETAPKRGTTFSVFLPVASSTANPQREADPPVPARGRGEAILVAEDNPHVRSVMTRSLQLGGYRVLEAASGPEAIAIWQDHRDEISLLLTDMVMPEGMDGRELTAKLRAEKPELRVVLCTGYSQTVAPAEAEERLTLLHKPFDAPELLRAIRSSLDTR